jgi:MFS family permease
MPFQQAMLPDLVPPEDIVGAVSLGSAQWNLGRVVGPALAGLVIVLGSFPLAFALNAVSFMAVALAFVFVRVPKPQGHSVDGTLLSHMRDGFRTAMKTPPVRTALTMIALTSATVAPFMALIPAMADSLVDGGPKALAGPTGALTTAQGVGAVIGAVLFPTLVERFGRRRMLLIVLAATPITLVPYALAPSVPAAVVAMFFVGGTYICILSGLSAVVQLRAPAAFRGRILSLYFATLSMIFPIGALVQGAIAERVGLAPTTIAGAVALLAALGLIGVSKPEILRVLELDTSLPPGHSAVVTDPAEPAATAT